MSVIKMTIRFFIFLVLPLISCHKDSIDNSKLNNNINTSGKCYDKIPDSTICLAYWENWFYNQTTNKCEKIGYSACEKKGCDTEQECLDCVNEKNKNLKSGKVVRFNFDKCGCCWGFVVLVENKEYLIDDPKLFALINYNNISSPINIELIFGSQNNDCADFVISGLVPATISFVRIIP